MGTSSDPGTTPLIIGNNGDAGSRTFHGTIDEVRIYNRALSASEVAARYAAQPEDQETIHYYLGGKQVAFKKGGTLLYLHQDSLGSSSVVTNGAGALVESTSYYPYGTRTGSITTTEEQFTGQRLDSTGLYYYNARYYAPEIGRFISADPAVPQWSNPQAWNPYSYVVNNPLAYADPSGLWFVVHDETSDRAPSGYFWVAATYRRRGQGRMDFGYGLAARRVHPLQCVRSGHIRHVLWCASLA